MAIRIGLGGGSPMAKQGLDRFFQYLDAAESQGWDSVWFSDRLIGPVWSMDPVVAMAMTAARTERLRFGAAVLLMSMRSPVATARAMATIDALSGGRLVVGVGVGQESPVEYDAMGVNKQERGRRLDEAIRVMRLLWTEELVTYQGRYVKLNNGGISPMPVQRPIPIWIGGRTAAALRRTGRLGDGWLPTQVTPEDVALGIRHIQECAAEAGRQVPEDHFGVNIRCYVVERGPVPMERVLPHLLLRRQDVPPERLCLLGTVDQVQARLQEYVKAGATKFVLGTACDPDETLEQMELQAEALVKPFHGAPV